MEDNAQNEDYVELGDKYIIKKEIDRNGDISIILLVEDKCTHKIYVAKTHNNEDYKYLIEKEIKIFQHLLNKQRHYIVDFIEDGEGNLIKKNLEEEQKKYIILEYCSKGTLFDYCNLLGKGFKKDFAKLIFYKILKRIEFIHGNEIVHLDIKLENILLDEQYNLKISNFTSSVKGERKKLENLKYHVGTKNYYSPQIFFAKEFKKPKIKFNGFKNDIYSLGICLFILVTGKLPFQDYKEYEDAISNFDSFFKKFETVNNINKPLSEEFKELFKRMISRSEEDRPSIEEIDKSLNVKDDELKKLEADLIKEFTKREDDINEIKHPTVKALDYYDNNQDNRTSGVEIIFTEEKPFPINEKELDNYIKIIGNLQYSRFMNTLYKELEKYNRKKEENEKWLQFTITVEREENNDEDNEMEEELKKELEEEIENEEEEEENDENEQDLKIKITLCENSNNEIYLKFLKESGDLEEYYDIFKKIVNIIKDKIL